MSSIDETGCTCALLASAERHCAAFNYFNKGLPTPSVYLLPRLSAKRLALFHAQGRLSLSDVDPTELTDGQKLVHRAALEGAPVIDRSAIQTFLNGLIYPLYFYDYETFGSAVPLASGHQPFAQMPVQFSLHRLAVDGTLTHDEWLASEAGQQDALIAGLQSVIGSVGSVISWNMSFERSCNERMARLLPQTRNFLDDLNSRTVDLMLPFKTSYVDIRFGGSTSIKKVLPILCPSLGYDQTAVHDGAGAMEAWLAMIGTSSNTERDRLRGELLAYCKLDTLAMVEIYRVLEALGNGSPNGVDAEA